jgi:signal transduction histidine kinase
VSPADPYPSAAHRGDSLAAVAPFARVSLAERLGRGPLGLGATLDITRDLLNHLVPLHARGRVHGALSPENVLLTECDGLTQATLLAPRLQTEAGPGGGANNHAYSAPEMLGAIDRRVDGRADLYSLGVVVLECLTGTQPFRGADLRETLRRQLSIRVPTLRSRGITAPRAVDELLAALLAADPDDRYDRADRVMTDVIRLIADIAAGEREPALMLGPRRMPAPSALDEPSFTGREAELRLLAGRLEDARHGTPRTVVLTAASGGGKTGLLDELCRHPGATDVLILRGQGVEGAGQRPLQVLSGVAEGIVEQAATDLELAGALRTRLAGHSGPLCELLPELAEVLDPRRSPTAWPGVHSESQTVAALVALLASLGRPGRPALVVLDDCQWADDLTVSVLSAWTSRGVADDASTHVALVVAMRSEAGSRTVPPTAFTGAELRALPPLAEPEVAAIITSMAGAVPAGVTEVVVGLSHGEPLLVSAVLRGLVEGGALTGRRGAWAFDAVPDGWQASTEAAGVLSRRIELLAPGTRRLLESGAVLGRRFTVAHAAQLAGQAPEETATAAVQALERNLVWSPEPGVLAFIHDRVRATLQGGLTEDRLAALHGAAAELLESAQAPPDFDLAYHFDAAGQPERAFPHALSSAAAARARQDLVLAVRQYEIAERGFAAATREERYRVHAALGQIHVLRGSYDAAAARFTRALTFADDQVQVATTQGHLGEVAFRQDDLARAETHIEAGLTALGERVPHARVAVWIRLAVELLRRMTRRVRPQRRSEVGGGSARDRLVAHLYTQLQYPRWFHARRVETLWLMVRQVNVAERCPNSRELVHAYSVWGGALALTFPFLSGRGLRYVDLSNELAVAHHDIRAQGHAQSMRTCVLLAAGRYADGEVSAAQALRVLSRVGDRWEQGFAARNRALCLYRTGRLREAAAEARRVHRIGLEVGDANAEVTALEVLAKSTGGRQRVPTPAVELLLRGPDLETRVAGLQAEALRLRHDGDLSGALDLLEQAGRAVREARPTNTYLVPVFAWLATVHRERIEGELLPGGRRRALRAARRATRRATRYARVYPNDRPHALREKALVAALGGRSRRARRLLRAAAADALRREAWAELAETRREADRFGMADALTGPASQPAPGGDGDLIPPPAGLADRFQALLEAGALLAAADDVDAVQEALSATAISLLRAEYVQVGFAVEGPDPAGGVEDAVRQAVDWLAEVGAPTVLDLEADRQSTPIHALVPAAARSALCAPLTVDGHCGGYLLIAHDRVPNLFGEAEERLTRFLVALAGAALSRQRLERATRAEVLAAAEAERTRISRDLHDEIGQAFTSVLLGVRLVENAALSGGNWQEVLTRTEHLRTLVTGGLDSVRRLAFELRPTVLDDMGLLAAVRQLVAAPRAGVEVDLETVGVDDGQRLPPDVETAAYRVIQEGLTNVARHAGPCRCSVVIGADRRRLRILIEDDGRGFTMGNGSERLGLRGVHERAALVGGTVRVTSAPGQGTAVVLEVPLEVPG